MNADKIINKIADNVADTLYIPLAMKCKETNKKSPFFSDSVSCSILDKIDYDFTKYNKAIRSSVGVCIRANYLDAITARFIRNNENPVVVNIGCGLDTRFFRMGEQITNKAIVYELDMPEVIELRKQLLPESKNNICLPYSMFETRWMDLLKEKHPDSHFIFVAEGVFMYFEKSRIREVFLNLTHCYRNAKIIFDVVSTWMCKNSHRHDTVKLTNARFKLACDDNHEFEKWNEKLKLLSAKYFTDFNDWKRAGLFNNLAMKLIPTIKNSSRILEYEIK